MILISLQNLLPVEAIICVSSLEKGEQFLLKMFCGLQKGWVLSSQGLEGELLDGTHSTDSGGGYVFLVNLKVYFPFVVMSFRLSSAPKVFQISYNLDDVLIYFPNKGNSLGLSSDHQTNSTTWVCDQLDIEVLPPQNLSQKIKSDFSSVPSPFSISALVPATSDDLLCRHSPLSHNITLSSSALPPGKWN